jgi:phenylacetate-CoA ligase
LAPRIRYNVHDAGGIVPFERVVEVLESFGFDLRHLDQAPEVAGPRGRLPWARPIPLPFLWIHGRRDATVSVMGSNIYPEDVEAVLYRDPLIAPLLHSFMLSVVDDVTGTPRPAVALELAALDGVDDAWRLGAGERIRDSLSSLNLDYRSSAAEFPAAMVPLVTTYAIGGGPFAGDATRIKQRRIAS